MYISSWLDFQVAAEDLYEKSPNETRYCVKWKASESKLVLKITDNTTCIQFKTHSSIFLNRFEALNLSLMEKMQNRRPAEPEPPTPVVHEETKPSTGSSAALITPGVPAAGGVKKKKPKKKK